MGGVRIIDFLVCTIACTVHIILLSASEGIWTKGGGPMIDQLNDVFIYCDIPLMLAELHGLTIYV